MKNKLIAGLLALMGLTVASCNDGGTPLPIFEYTNIVTVASTGPEGTVFTFQELNDSPEITLTTTQYFQDNTIVAGTRIVLTYIPESEEEYVSGPVRVVSFLRTLGGDISEGKNSESWGSSAIFLRALWRTGSWLNMDVVLDTAIAPRRFALVLDENTADNEYPELHIAYTPAQTISGGVAFYGSFDIEKVWNGRNVKGLRIIYLGADGQENTLTLEKTSPEITPAE